MRSTGFPPDVTSVSIAEVWSERDRLKAVLTPDERAVYDAFQVEKRRQDWLAGRVAGKWAVERATGLPMTRIEIRTDAIGPTRGRPYAAITGRGVTLGGLSITHAGWIAAATFSDMPVGLDLELAIPRDESFETIAFTAEERRAWSHLYGAARDRAITRAWCMKEAIAKWRGTGLRAPFDELLLREDPTVKVEEGVIDQGDLQYCWAKVLGPFPQQPRKQRGGDARPRPREESRA